MRDVDERCPPGEVEVWADTVKFYPRRKLVVDKARGWRRRPERRVSLFDDAVRAIGRRVDEAVAEGSHVRVQGARWSFSAVTATSDVMLETLSRLSQIIDVAGPYPETDPDDPGPLSRALRPDLRQANGRAYVYLEGGAKMSGVLGALDDLGLSVETAGSSSGQSIAGFLGTGSHGPDFDMPPMADYVRALVLIGPDGKARWVERASEPLTIDAATIRRELLPCTQELVRDDDAFDAAVVSLGALGVIAGLVLQVREEYGLWERVERSEEDGPDVTWEGTRDAVRDGTIFVADDPAGGVYRSLELLINPFPTSAGKHYAHIVRRFEHTVFTGEKLHRAGTPFLSIALALLSNDPARFRAVTEKLLRAGRDDSEEAYSAHEVIDYGDSRLERTWSAEVCLGTRGGHHVDFLDEVLARFDARVGRGELLAGFLAIRFTQATRAPLGLETGTGRTCHVELHVSQGIIPLWDETDPEKEGENFFADFVEVGKAYRAAGHALFHWGQQHGSIDNLTPTDATHPDLARWRAGRDRLLVGWPYAFANELVVRTGLLPLPAGFALEGFLPSPAGRRLEADQRARVAASPVVVAPPVNPGGTPALFACNAHGAVSVQEVAAGGWTAIGDDVDDDECPDGSIGAATRSDGRRVLVCRAEDGDLRVRCETEHGWTDWEKVDDDLRSDPVLAADAQGTLFIFAVDDDGVLRRWTEDGDHWSGGAAFARPDGNDLDGAPAVALISGALHVVARDRDGRLLRASEAAPNVWTELAGMPAPAVGAPALAVAGDEVFVVVPLGDGHLWCGRYDSLWGHPRGSRCDDHDGVLEGTGVSVAPRAGKWAVTHTDTLRRARLSLVDGVRWPNLGSAFEVDAVSAPVLAGDRLIVKVAHDIVVSRAVSFS